MKQTLKNLLADGKTKRVIDELRQFNLADTDLNAEIVQLSARFSQYDHQKRMAVEDPSVLGIELRKINSALLSVIDRLDEQDERSGNLQGFPNVDNLPITPKRHWLRIGAWLIAAIGVLASIGQITGISLKDVFAAKAKDSQTVAVPNKSDTVIIKGIVKTQAGDNLSDVKIAVDNSFITSDSNGYFELPIKTHQDGTNYRINISKAGFETKNETYIPDSQIPEFRLHKK